MALTFENLPLPAHIRPAQPMTDEEIMRFSAENAGVRIEREPNGDILVMTPTGSEGSGMNSEINADLTIWARQDGRGKVFDSNGGFTLPDGSMRAADAAWLLLSHWNKLTLADQKRFAPICPDFVIELRSPSDNLPDLQAKMDQWIANGDDTAWLIDPIEKTIHIYRPGQSPEVHNHPTSVQGSGIIAGFELVMERIWQ